MMPRLFVQFGDGAASDPDQFSGLVGKRLHHYVTSSGDSFCDELKPMKRPSRISKLCLQHVVSESIAEGNSMKNSWPSDLPLVV